ncbi:hypothetical protein VCV18_005723 [Metarhizium anisopliae]
MTLPTMPPMGQIGSQAVERDQSIIAHHFSIRPPKTRMYSRSPWAYRLIVHFVGVVAQPGKPQTETNSAAMIEEWRIQEFR